MASSNEYNKRSQMRIRREARAFRNLRQQAQAARDYELLRVLDDAFDDTDSRF
ncbi:hypothetical protein [Rhodococcus artemisiae]|uniref:Transcriptional regulator n=1 Tax=Rhodococcus artemisiae TaxID=714159 RepID=A0ABU7L4X8_9NOCA|nr:hypothetical protein [Rhodococcus artemisiae]MEE2056606.1 hypothetical protein [Rhodococcus artemisiae]